MKYFLIIVISLSLFSCTKTKNNDLVATGTVVGIDPGMCICCGGYILKLDDSTKTYRFFSFPDEAHIDSTHFPIRVYLTYKETNMCGFIHFVKVQSMIKLNN